MTTFTTVLPDNYDTSTDWYFVWHAPDPEAMVMDHGWDAAGKYVPMIKPDASRRRGTGMPMPAMRLGLYARLNTEGQNWGWMPMADFAAMLATPQNAGNEGLLAHVAKLEEQVAARDTAMSAARKAMVAAQDGMERAWEALA
jgi:hypothetical protein